MNMKGKILALVIAAMISVSLSAQQKTENCPRGGQENCTGICGRFTDENKDGYCDYSKLTENKNLQKDQARDKKIKEEKRQNRQKGENAKQEHKCKHSADGCKAKAEGKSCCKDKQAATEKSCCKKDAKTYKKDMKECDNAPVEKACC
ncbi:MAG: hypothetical protein IJ250_07625, partial [Bacteroidales bacterium]|nr:hypothetical protein [Bacteroidales bacterium]